jgi:hypothetical protein
MVVVSQEGKKVIRDDNGAVYPFDPRTQHEVVWRKRRKGGSKTRFGRLTPACTLRDGDRVYFQTAANNEVVSVVGLPPDPARMPERLKERKQPPRHGGQVLLVRGA